MPKCHFCQHHLLMLVVWTSCLVVVVTTTSSPEYVCTDHTDCHNGGICQASSFSLSSSSATNSTATSSTQLRGTKNTYHCHCPMGFSGPRCTRYCPLSCQNGGMCTTIYGGSSSSSSSSSSSTNVGVVPKQSIQQHSNDTEQQVQEENSIKDQNHPVGYGKSFMEEQIRLDQDHYFVFDPNKYQCKCKGYWTGELCEIPYVNCGGGKDRRCYHGGRCIYYGNDDSDPTTITTTNSTTIRVGCDCPDGYGGESCRSSVVAAPAPQQQQDDEELSSGTANGMSLGGKVSLSLVLILATLTCLVVLYKMATTQRLLHCATFTSAPSRSSIITLPRVVQDATSTTSTPFMMSHHDHSDHDDKSSSSSSSSCSESLLPILE
jgi:hypothetical protein